MSAPLTTRTQDWETLATGYGLVEGPRVDDQNRLYYSDARNGGVYCRTPEGRIETVVPKRRGVGGIAIHAEGGVVVSGRNICHVRDGQSRILFERSDTPGFNDLFADAQGRIFVGSQRYNPLVKGAKMVPGELYRIDGEGEAEMLYDDVGLTNGIGFSPDGKCLYHNDSARNQVLVHDMAADGSCTNRRVFAEPPRGAPDGLAVDEEGGVWVAAYGAGCAVRFAYDGTVDFALEVPSKEIASLCFGGPDRRDLYVATADKGSAAADGGGIYRTRVEVAGLPAPLARI